MVPLVTSNKLEMNCWISNDGRDGDGDDGDDSDDGDCTLEVNNK